MLTGSSSSLLKEFYIELEGIALAGEGTLGGCSD